MCFYSFQPVREQHQDIQVEGRALRKVKYGRHTMNPFQRQPDRSEMIAMLKVNAVLLGTYIAAIRATPLVG